MHTHMHMHMHMHAGTQDGHDGQGRQLPLPRGGVRPRALRAGAPLPAPDRPGGQDGRGGAARGAPRLLHAQPQPHPRLHRRPPGGGGPPSEHGDAARREHTGVGLLALHAAHLAHRVAGQRGRGAADQPVHTALAHDASLRPGGRPCTTTHAPPPLTAPHDLPPPHPPSAHTPRLYQDSP